MNPIFKTSPFSALICAGWMLAVNCDAQFLLTNGLIAHYPLDGNVIDVSGNGYDGTNYNVTFGVNRTGQANAAARFNGTSSYILLPSALADQLSGTNPMSVSVWMQTTSAALNNNRSVFDTGAGATDEMFGLGMLGGQPTGNGYVVYSEFGADYNLTNGFSIADSLWHHCVGSFDGTNLSLFVDGLFQAVRPVVSDRAATAAVIGVRVDLDPSECWDGVSVTRSTY